MVNTRRPGRPKGTTIDDGQALARIADLRAADSTLSFAAASKKVLQAGGHAGGHSDQAVLARWRRKGIKQRDADLEAAKQRLARKKAARSAPSSGGYIGSPLSHIGNSGLAAATSRIYDGINRAFEMNERIMAPIRRMQEMERATLGALHSDLLRKPLGLSAQVEEMMERERQRQRMYDEATKYTRWPYI